MWHAWNTILSSHLGTIIKQLIAAYTKAAVEVKNDVTILLENTAGQKNSVGSRMDSLEAY